MFVMLLGNLTTAIYIIYCINDANKDVKKFFLGKIFNLSLSCLRESKKHL